ncbi:MAG: hypothetical protein Ct9H300mP20_20580 [Gammaproteobacteria bacterium]|nr:MAG: hypothetical protein Ct9H300mP20_20580 [Gammaproteobacteria bacterium]
MKTLILSDLQVIANVFPIQGYDNLSLRGTTSTGFRAPTPGQANISNISTVADAGGDLYQKGTLAPTTLFLFTTVVKS